MEEIFSSVLTGGFLIVIGLVFIFFHEELRRVNDRINRKVFGAIWTGVYPMQIVLLIRAVHTVTGLLLVLFGISIVLNILQS